MMKDSEKNLAAALLRQKAEALRNERASRLALDLSEADAKKLIHELEVHQIELEMQNEELMRAQTAVKEFADKYVELYDFSPSGYVTLTKDGGIEQLNLACARMLGKERSRLINTLFRLHVSSETRPAFDLFFQNVIENKAAATCEAVLSAGESSPISVQLSGILSADGLHLMITLIDVTARKEAEEKLLMAERTYRGILDMITEVVYIEDADGTILNVNRAAETMFGYGKDELIGRTLELLAAEGENDLSQLRSHYKGALEGVPQSFELIGRHKDGMLFPIEVGLSLGNYFGREVIIAVARDITHRKEMDQMTRDVQRREAIGVLSAGIAHDFNNLLAVMMGNVSLAETKLSPQHPAYGHMEKAELAMKRAAELTNQILAYSGKGKNQIERLDLREEIEQHMSLFRISMPKNVKLSARLPSTPLHVCGDPGQIKQIIMNLVSNGAEAIGDKQGTVSITLDKVMPGPDELVRYGRITNTLLKKGAYALLEVSDSGLGMSKETIATIFDPFFTTKFTGRGLGLSAVLGIIRGHEGGITIESAEGAGSSFRVILPVCDGPGMEDPGKAESVDLNAAEKTTILLIDDEPDVAAMAKDLLETAHYTVIAELNPVRAIELYRGHQDEIGAVLLDWTMPEISGKEVAEALAAINPAAKIIISSGYSPDDIKTQIDAAIVSGFLQKPYTLQSLLTMVRSVMTSSM